MHENKNINYHTNPMQKTYQVLHGSDEGEAHTGLVQVLGVSKINNFVYHLQRKMLHEILSTTFCQKFEVGK